MRVERCPSPSGIRHACPTVDYLPTGFSQYLPTITVVGVCLILPGETVKSSFRVTLSGTCLGMLGSLPLFAYGLALETRRDCAWVRTAQAKTERVVRKLFGSRRQVSLRLCAWLPLLRPVFSVMSRGGMFVNGGEKRTSTTNKKVLGRPKIIEIRTTSGPYCTTPALGTICPC